MKKFMGAFFAIAALAIAAQVGADTEQEQVALLQKDIKRTEDMEGKALAEKTKWEQACELEDTEFHNLKNELLRKVQELEDKHGMKKIDYDHEVSRETAKASECQARLARLREELARFTSIQPLGPVVMAKEQQQSATLLPLRSLNQ